MKLRQLTFALLAAFGLAASAANVKTTVSQVTGTVELTTDVDYIVTGDEPFATTGSVNIVNKEHAVLIISSIKPSKVLSNWMKFIYINGEAAKDGTNCQVKMYNRGTIIFPYASNFQPLTCYTEQNYGGESCSNYSEGSNGGYMKTLSTSLLNNKIRSFKLKRGYMVTFAIGTGGWGYSRCFIADQEDLEVATLPTILDQRISSYRIFKWQNAHKASLANDTGYNITQALNVTSCYSFGLGENRYPDTECVPHHIYENWPSPTECGNVTYSCHLKTNNEPGNSADPSPQDVATVLANWQNLMRTGMRLCSESSHDGSWAHLRAFIDSIDARGWRCDILDLHCYWGAGSFGDFSNYYNNYGGRPIWISEWVWGASWNASNWSSGGIFAQAPDGAGSYSTANQQTCLNGTKPILEKLNASKYVERYYYWNSENLASKIYYNGGLSLLGQYYANMNDGMGYDASIQKIPTATRLEGLSELTSEYKSAAKTVKLTWSDPNGDLSEAITVQRALLPITKDADYKDVATITPQDKNSAAGPTYTYTEEIDEPGAYSYRIKVVTYNKKKLLSSTVNVNVDPAQGFSGFQYGKLMINNTNENKIKYTELFPEGTIFHAFIGPMSNSNSSFYAGNNVTSPTSDREKLTYQPLQWQNNSATVTDNMEVPFLVLNEGDYLFDDLYCEVDSVKANRNSGTNTFTDPTEVTFHNPFPEGVTPIVLTEIFNPSFKTKTSLCTRVYDVTNTGFKFIIYSEDGTNQKVTMKQNVSYLAIAPGIGTVDKDNGIIIAAGHSDAQAYGNGIREMKLLIPANNGGESETEQLYLYNPTILCGLQTNNYPSLCMLRRGSNTEVVEDGTTWLTAIRVKRILDHDLSTSVTKTTSLEEYRDNVGWVAISVYKEGGSTPTAIKQFAGETSKDHLKPRVVNGRIYVDGASSFEVYSIAGAKQASNTSLKPGIYVVKAHGKSAKVLVK